MRIDHVYAVAAAAAAAAAFRGLRSCASVVVSSFSLFVSEHGLTQQRRVSDEEWMGHQPDLPQQLPRCTFKLL
jgi:hypothetical protein